MSSALEPSKPEAIGRGTAVIELAEPGPDGPIRIRIRSMDMVALLDVLGGLPGVPNTEAGAPVAPINVMAKLRAGVAQAQEKYRTIARHTAVEPPFYFGDEGEDATGKADWNSLSYRNQESYALKVMAFSGDSAMKFDIQSVDGGAAVRAAKFSEEPAGA